MVISGISCSKYSVYSDSMMHISSISCSKVLSNNHYDIAHTVIHSRSQTVTIHAERVLTWRVETNINELGGRASGDVGIK